jgi:hypothetical protein
MSRGYESVRAFAWASFVAVMCLASGCRKGSALSEQAPSGAEGTSGHSASPAMAAAPTGDEIGVAECDEYLQKMEACAAKMPEQARAPNLISLQQSRKSWKQAASSEGSKADLKMGCQAALDAFAQNPQCK